MFWDPAWDASESALTRGGTAYWSAEALSALGPSEWISAHRDPADDSVAARRVRERILRNHPALLDAAAWESRTYLGLDVALGSMPEDVRMGPGVAGLPAEPEVSGALTRRGSRAALAMGTKADDLRRMIVAHVRQCGSTTGAQKRTIIVEREEPLQSLLSSSVTQVRCCDDLRVGFRREPGKDDGGVKRDFFTTMMHAFVGCGRYEERRTNLFTHTEDNGYVFRINPKSSTLGTNADRLFEAFGWLLARALVDSVLLDVHFQPAFYKSLLSDSGAAPGAGADAAGCELADLEACDKKLFDSLTELLAMPEEEVELVCYTFSIPDDSSPTAGATRELKPNGSIDVTAANREEFVQLWSRWIMVGRVEGQRASIRRGFEQVLPLSVVRSAGLSAREFEAVLCGSSEIDVDDWQRNVLVKGNLPESSAVVARFWSAVRAMDQPTRSALLRFVTGTPKIPPGGFAALEGSNGKQRMTVQVVRWDISMLPKAATCYNALQLPPYPSEVTMRRKLEFAALETEGFGFA